MVYTEAAEWIQVNHYMNVQVLGHTIAIHIHVPPQY